MTNQRYLYVSAQFNHSGAFSDERLTALSERHKLRLEVPTLTPCTDPCGSKAAGTDGVVMEMLSGCPTRRQMLAAAAILKHSDQRVWFYWPNEMAIECVDHERLRSYRHLWLVVCVSHAGAVPKGYLRPAYRLARRFMGRPQVVVVASGSQETGTDLARRVEAEALAMAVAPLPSSITAFETGIHGQTTVKGNGVYLRTDFWARLSSGGSYGHTCYVAKSLAKVTDDMVCFMAAPYALLDQLGLRQVVLDPPGDSYDEAMLLRATDHYYARLKAAIEALRPAFIYERLVLGNYVGAKLSRDLGIPYIVEYNGSEISMSKSFGGGPFVYESTHLRIEEAAFRQATAISVVSEPIKEELVKRGIGPEKILVNPNGVDLDRYTPATDAERAVLREELGFHGEQRVIGFIGTFGGWHGIDVLAAAIPRICEQVPEARFLLIGDGSYKGLIDEQVLKHGLAGRVRSTGALPQAEGARLLRACDIFVSPHSAHMVDSRFFGSPTKVFEYMALAGGIVASDLEQIGEVLSPALRSSDLGAPAVRVTEQRSVLCEPGNVDQFVEAVVFLARNPDVCSQLGQNARRAAAAHYAWDRHVARLLTFIEGASDADAVNVEPERIAAVGGGAPALISAPRRTHIQTGDAYKDEVQNQWDNNPCGSQYGREATTHTLEWFLNIEAHRYGEYGPWMPETMEFASHRGKELLEIGAGLGTDLSQFAKNGAIVTDVDLSSGHLALARENFRLRGLTGRFIHQDAETLPFPDGSFDVVYSNGVIHHTPNTDYVIDEIWRVLRPGGKAIIMVYAENSIYYWRDLVGTLGLKQGMLQNNSIGHVMSCSVEMNENDARPLVKVYTKPRLRQMFSRFTGVSIVQRQLTAPELPRSLSWLGLSLAGKMMGWNLIVKAYKPR